MGTATSEKQQRKLKSQCVMESGRTEKGIWEMHMASGIIRCSEDEEGNPGAKGRDGHDRQMARVSKLGHGVGVDVQS